MQAAIAKVRSREMTLWGASTAYNVPKSTLANRVLNRNKIATESKKYLGQFFKTFNEEFELD